MKFWRLDLNKSEKSEKKSGYIGIQNLKWTSKRWILRRYNDNGSNKM